MRMTPARTLMAALVALAAPTPGAPARADLTIAEGGKSPYRIVVAADAIPAERHAAEELQAYIERIAGARLPIATAGEPGDAHEIALGLGAAPADARAGIDPAALGADGFVLRTVGDRLLITGGRPRGTLYGVYALLEDRLGVRWFAPGVESVPEADRLVVPALDETQVPPLEYREVFWSEFLHDADFAARHRLNGAHYALTDRHGGRGAVYYPFVHSLDMLVPPGLYAEHPEYFPLIDGRRKNGYVQRCLSNPEVVRMATDRVLRWIDGHPEANIISVSQNDTINYCQCPECKALDEAEGTPAASLIRFVNAIAEVVAEKHPEVRIDTLAYQYTRTPPKTLRPRPNVIIRLCSIECCFAHPLDACPAPEDRRFVADIEAWEPVAPRLYIWDYTTNFAHYQRPFPNLDALQGNVRFFVRHGVKGLFEQGNYSAGGHGEMEPLRAYLLAKLLWNPDADVARHTDEFLRGYYGEAAGPIRRYLDLTHRPGREQGRHLHIYDPPRMADDELDAADALFDEAERLAGDEAVRERVRVARLPVWYARLAAGRLPDAERAALRDRFLDVARRAGISHISEGRTLDQWAGAMGAK